ncbi:MMPL family transporter [Mycobacterium shinjukuense]|nr:MMPL family transporter [Mycobacterium shinjukuense]
MGRISSPAWTPSVSADRSRLAKLLTVTAWIAVAVIANLTLALTPPKSGDTGSALLPHDATRSAAASRIAAAFPGTGSNALAYLVLEGRDPLGPADQRYYDAAVSALRADTRHVGSVLDWWSDPLTAPVATSADGRCGSALVWLVGQAGTAQARESLDAARSVLRALPPGAGLRARIVVPATTAATPMRMTWWQGAAIVIAAALIAVLLLLRARRSRKAAGIALLTAGLSLAVAWPLAAVVSGPRGGTGSGLSTFSATLAAVLMIAAITTSAVLVGRPRPDASAGTAGRRAYRNNLPGLALPGAGLALLTGPLLFARTPALHAVGMATPGVAVAVAACLTLLPSLIGLAGPWGQSPSPTVGAVWTPALSIPGLAHPAVVTAVVLAICALPVIGMRWGLAESPTETRHAQSLAGSPVPDVVVIQSAHDLRDPAGLIAIDRVSRRLMELPGVRKVQSAAWPGGVPWTEATLTSAAGRLADQLDRQAATFVPQVNAIKTLQSVVDQVSGAVNELEHSVTAGVAGLTEMQQDIDQVISGTRNIKATTEQVSGYLDPVRGWMGGIENCPADALCSAARKVVDPFDRVVADVAVLSDGADQIAAVSARTVSALASTPRVVAQMRSALGQLRSFVPALKTTVEDTIPQVVQLSAFLRKLSIDFADTGEGGFYLSTKALADPSYRNVRQWMFSTDGTATRLFVYSEGDALDLDAGRRAHQLETVARTNYGSLVDSQITVSGAAQVAATVRGALTHDAVLLAVTMLAVVALVGMWRGAVGGLVTGLGVLACHLAALGTSVALWQHLLGRELQASVPLVSFALLAACGVPYLVATLIDAGPRPAGTGSLGRAVAPIMVLGAVFGLGLVLVSGGAVGALGQVGTIVLVGVGALTAVARTWLPRAPVRP